MGLREYASYDCQVTENCIDYSTKTDFINWLISFCAKKYGTLGCWYRTFLIYNK